MEIDYQQLLTSAAVMGIIATLSIDIWAQLLKRAGNISPTNWAMVGRWFAHLPRGAFKHESIGKADTISHELFIGWTAHYVVGISYALIYVTVCTLFSLPISLLSATCFGLITVAAPWLILQPGLGLGHFASKTPSPNKTRLLNVVAHTLFGSVLYLSWTYL